MDVLFTVADCEGGNINIGVIVGDASKVHDVDTLMELLGGIVFVIVTNCVISNVGVAAVNVVGARFGDINCVSVGEALALGVAVCVYVADELADVDDVSDGVCDIATLAESVPVLKPDADAVTLPAVVVSIVLVD